MNTTTTTDPIESGSDFYDVRDVIARVEELEAIDGIEDKINALEQDDEATELVMLRELLGNLKGNGGDEQWRGDWYPVTLIRDSHFEDYAQELAEDIGAIGRDQQWPLMCIDWEAAANMLKQDYATVNFDGVTYWYR